MIAVTRRLTRYPKVFVIMKRRCMSPAGQARLDSLVPVTGVASMIAGHSQRYLLKMARDHEDVR